MLDCHARELRVRERDRVRNGSHLDDTGACSGGDDGGGGADVKGVVAIAARTDDIDHEFVVSVLDDGLDRTSVEDFGCGDEVIGIAFESVGVHGSEKGADLDVGDDIGSEEQIEGSPEVSGCEEVGGLDELGEERLEGFHCRDHFVR